VHRAHRKGITKAVGGHVQFNFFHRWFDILFIVSAGICLVLFVSWWLVRRHVRSRAKAHEA
jgi:hypothetical protein